MSERWQQYFAELQSHYTSPLAEAVDHWAYYTPLHGHIQSLIPRGGRILDIGCGMGYSDVYMQALGYKVVGIDNDQSIVDKAAANAEWLRSDVRFEQADAFNLSKYYDSFDIVYSVGVVEHFDPDVTVQLIREQSKCAPLVLTLIPTRFIKYSAGRTDERIYNIKELCALSEKAGLETVGRFGFGDIVAPKHIAVKRLLPYGLFRLLQNRFSYSMGIICVGRRRP